MQQYSLVAYSSCEFGGTLGALGIIYIPVLSESVVVVVVQIEDTAPVVAGSSTINL